MRVWYWLPRGHGCHRIYFRSVVVEPPAVAQRQNNMDTKCEGLLQSKVCMFIYFRAVIVESSDAKAAATAKLGVVYFTHATLLRS